MNQIKVEYRSIWEEGEVSTFAKLNLDTGEVTEIELSDQGLDYEHLIEEFVYSLDQKQSGLISWNDSDRAFVDLDEWRES